MSFVERVAIVIKERKEREKKTEKCEQITQQILRQNDVDVSNNNYTPHSTTFSNACMVETVSIVFV